MDERRKITSKILLEYVLNLEDVEDDLKNKIMNKILTVQASLN